MSVLGMGLAVAGFAASYGPSPYENSQFWTSSPSFFFLRTGLLVALIGAAYLWERRPWRRLRVSPLEYLGRSSLFVYWIHVELIYGLMVRPLHKSVSFPAAAGAILPFAALMFLSVLLKERVVAYVTRRRAASVV
jgi:fucose 4-O-acetylase-like acetyltransferase